MKILSEKAALERLAGLKSAFKETITVGYEHRAKSCLTCDVKGSCCTDEHFVNVHISRLEAVTINRAFGNLPSAKRAEIEGRISQAVQEYKLDSDPEATFACPLFEREVGCLVHEHGKPTACIAHACYEREQDLPPDALLIHKEAEIDEINRRTYASPQPWLPLPAALQKYR